MNKTYREFDTDRLSTPPSRSVRIARNSENGFTLIELLVVISIIALLSTVVIAALGDSRMRARNVAKNDAALEYVKALELYRSDNANSYPVTTATPLCFGYATGETCYMDTRSGSTTLTTAMQPYLAGNYAHKVSLPSSGGDLKGILYACNGTGSCSSYTMIWVLEGMTTSCPPKATAASVLGNRSCTYTQS